MPPVDESPRVTPRPRGIPFPKVLRPTPWPSRIVSGVRCAAARVSSGAWSLPQPQGAQRSPATGRNVSRIGEPPQEALRADFSGVRSVAFGGGPRFAALGTRVAPRKSSEPPVSSFHRFEVWSRRKSRGPRSVAALNRRIPAPSWRFRIPSLPPATMSCPRALPGTPLRPRTPHRCPTTGRASDLRAAVCWLLACVLLTGAPPGETARMPNRTRPSAWPSGLVSPRTEGMPPKRSNS